MMQRKIRCAIVGLGRIGSLLEEDSLREKPCTHAGAVTADADCTLVGGCDLREDRRREFSRRWNCGEVFTDVYELLDGASPDILHVATPPSTHLQMVEAALGSSVRLIICEKPLALSVDDAARIAEHHRQHAVKIMTNHERRYSVDYLRVKDLIEESTLGELLSVNGSIYMGQRRPASQMLLDDGTHLIDILSFLTGSTLTLESTAYRATEQGGSLFIGCSAGEVPVHMEIGSGRDHIVFEIDLSFSSGRIRIGNGLFEVYRSAQSPFYDGLQSLLHTDEAAPEVTGFFSNMLRDAVRCVRDPAAVPRSTAEHGYGAVSFIEQVLAGVGAGVEALV
jgi:predicted dehydrogenase